MDRLESIHPKRLTKTTKTKKKPVRVVYISSPMKVKTSVSEFRALVQELTGQDAVSPDATKFSGTDDVGGNQMEVLGLKKVANIDNDDQALEVPIVVDHGNLVAPCWPDLDFEPFDHGVFTPQMLENFTGSFPSW